MEVSGWIILDKPSGMTSRRAGAICARMIGAKTFGHIGTLDPMASGLLPIAFGQASKMIPYLGTGDLGLGTEKKEYLFDIEWGVETDTLDITGKTINTSSIVPHPSSIAAACRALVGEIMQVPPAYSAVHINGRRSYELARAGQTVAPAPRKVTVYELEPGYRLVCSTGTYVRAIVRDIAEICGTKATTSMIRRVKTNGFDIKDAVKLDFLENLYNNRPELVLEYLKPVDFGLDDILVARLDDNDAKLFQNGGVISVADESVGLRRVYHESCFLGIGMNDNHVLMPRRIIN